VITAERIAYVLIVAAAVCGYFAVRLICSLILAAGWYVS
jgi:hypothetical protein